MAFLCIGKNTLTIGAIVGAIFVLLATSASMGIPMNGSMGHCPFSPGGSLCAMGLQEHLNAWQTAFSAIPQKGVIISLLFLTLWVLSAAIFSKALLLVHSKIPFLFYRHYARQSILTIPADQVHRALSRGILSPKLF